TWHPPGHPAAPCVLSRIDRVCVAGRCQLEPTGPGVTVANASVALAKSTAYMWLAKSLIVPDSQTDRPDVPADRGFPLSDCPGRDADGGAVFPEACASRDHSADVSRHGSAVAARRAASR